MTSELQAPNTFWHLPQGNSWNWRFSPQSIAPALELNFEKSIAEENSDLIGFAGGSRISADEKMFAIFSFYRKIHCFNHSGDIVNEILLDVEGADLILQNNKILLTHSDGLTCYSKQGDVCWHIPIEDFGVSSNRVGQYFKFGSITAIDKFWYVGSHKHVIKFSIDNGSFKTSKQSSYQFPIDSLGDWMLCKPNLEEKNVIQVHNIITDSIDYEFNTDGRYRDPGMRVDNFIVFSNGKTLQCYDAPSGQKRWQVKVPRTNTLATDGERVFIQSWPKGLSCLDLISGEEIWKREYENHYFGTMDFVVSNENIHTWSFDKSHNHHNLVSFEKITGNELWKSEPIKRVNNDMSSNTSGVPLQAFGNGLLTNDLTHVQHWS